MFIIIFEGLDNAGKTTLISSLYEKLFSQGFRVVQSKELSTMIGAAFKIGLQNGIYSPINKTLLFASDRQERIEEILEDDSCDIVLFDRYYYSAIVYRMVEGLDESWIKAVNKFNPKEDLGFYIDITPEESFKRRIDTKFNLPYSLEQLKKIRGYYMRFVRDEQLLFIDGMRNKEEVLAKVLETIYSFISDTRER